MPSPNHYALTMPWPGKCSELKHISDKTNFIDTCQYESNHNPGPGTYIVRTQIGCKE